MGKSSDVATSQEVTKFKEVTKSNAEQLVTEEFPKKVIYLDKLYKSALVSFDRLVDIAASTPDIPCPEPILLNSQGKAIAAHGVPKKRKRSANDGASMEQSVDGDGNDAPTGSKVAVLTSGMVRVNTPIKDIIDVVKPLIREAIEQTNTLKMWIQYMIPKIEDGNNFGVSIQEDTQAQISQAEQDCAGFLESFNRYYTARARLVSKVAKYPHIEDYRQAIIETDEKQLVNLRLIICELRNVYASLHDLIVKNLEKIKTPRGELAFKSQMY